MANEKFRIGRKITSRLTRKPPVLSSPYHVIIWQLIKDPDDFSGVDWSRETQVAKELYTAYPNLKFWSQINLGFYLNSLHFFKGTNGIKHLKKAVLDFETVGSSSVIISEVKKEEFDETKTFNKKINPSSKPLTYKDFFKNGKKTK